MDRREFLKSFTCGLVAAPVAAQAQPCNTSDATGYADLDGPIVGMTSFRDSVIVATRTTVYRIDHDGVDMVVSPIWYAR